ncbi:MAG: type II secretion system protein [Planctomycetes bacterium]|nr:type II secretion system protein [Planctomycetota bacterium]
MLRGSREARSAGFTLIELLVVIAIISLLMSILLPVCNRAREQAKIVACKSNFKTFWQGVVTYAFESKDRMPFMENVNVPTADPNTGPNADPFDPRYPTTAGNVLLHYVGDGSWRCPSAIMGYPFNAGASGFKMTYGFGVETFGGIGTVIPFDSSAGRGPGGPADQSNYWPFDGRPIKLLDGRRYGRGVNENAKGRWEVRFPIFYDLPLDEGPGAGVAFAYPHHGKLDTRNDLENARDQFERNTHTTGGGYLSGRIELHADGEKPSIFYTRDWREHAAGY